MASDVLDRLSQLLPAQLNLASLGDPPARAVAAIHRAAVHREEQNPVGVFVDDRRNGPMRVLPERVDELAGPNARLVPNGNRLHPDGTERMVWVHERQVVGGDSEAKYLRRFLEEIGRAHVLTPVTVPSRMPS